MNVVLLFTLKSPYMWQLKKKNNTGKVPFQKTTLYFIKNNFETAPITLQQLKNTVIVHFLQWVSKNFL